MNSKIGWFLISKFCTAIQNGYQLIWNYLGQIPIATGHEDDSAMIIGLVNQILFQKKQNPESDTTSLESQIDQFIYQLYSLTPEEIAIVENSLATREMKGTR